MAFRENLCAVLHATGDLRLDVRPVPTPGPNDALLEMKNVGLCGTDVHFFQHGSMGRFVLKAPMITGHESSAVVVSVGKDVTHLKQGDRVAIEPGVGCRKCKNCKTGRYNLCPNLRSLSLPPKDGNLCRYSVHDADFVHKIPDHMTFEEAALLEPLSVAVYACVKRAGITGGDNVLITGAGPIGLVNLLVAKALGASKIILTDVLDTRLQAAKQLGATATVNVAGKSEDSLVREIVDLFGVEPNRSLECTGTEPGLRLAMMATAAGGVLTMVGLGGDNHTVPLTNACLKEVDIRGVFLYPNCYPLAMSMVASGSVDVRPLVTHRFTLEQTLEAFDTAIKRKGNPIKIMLSCE